MTGSSDTHPHIAGISRRGTPSGLQPAYYAAQERPMSPQPSSRHHTLPDQTDNVSMKGNPVNLVRAWQGSDHDVVARPELSQKLPAHNPQPPTNSVSHHGAAHSLAHNKTEPGGARAVVIDDVNYRSAGYHPATATHRRTKIGRLYYSVRSGKHCRRLNYRFTRKVQCGPCDDGHQEWHVRRGCAYEGGTRAPWHDGGCSAGMFSCS